MSILPSMLLHTIYLSDPYSSYVIFVLPEAESFELSLCFQTFFGKS